MTLRCEIDLSQRPQAIPAVTSGKQLLWDGPLKKREATIPVFRLVESLPLFYYGGEGHSA